MPKTINRWWDKTMQLVFFKSGKAGIIMEHSMNDGMMIARVLEETMGKLEKPNFLQELAIIDQGSYRNTPSFKRIMFQLDDHMNFNLSDCLFDYTRMSDDQDVNTLEFTDFGAKDVKKMGFAPDTFVQMAIQLAQKKLTGLNAPTYEVCQVRCFRFGRTAAIRSCSENTAAWVDMMIKGENADKKECF